MKKLFYVMLFASTLVTAVSSCKKDKKTPPAVPPAGAVQLWGNVHIIDSTQWILYINSIQPANGLYMYSFTPSTPNIPILQAGDILLGASNGGYIRKVLSTTIAGAYYYVYTEQAYMSDVFKSGSFSFQIPLNDTSQGTGVSRTYSNLSLFHETHFDVTLLSGQFNVQPTLNYNFSFDSISGLTNFQVTANNASLADNLNISLKGVMPYAWSAQTTIGTYSVNSFQQVQAWTPTGNVAVPVVVKLGLNLIANLNGGSSASDTFNTRLTWSSNSIFTSSMQYHGTGPWQPQYSSVATNVVAFDTFTQVSNSFANLSFMSKISSSFYTVAGPQFSIGLSGSLQQIQRDVVNSPFFRKTMGWSSATYTQAGGSIIGQNVPSFSQSWTSDSVLYESPYQVTIISGDNQTGNVISTLPLPLVLKVTDSNGQPASHLPVAFAVTHGGGTLSAYNLLTDQNGLAQVTWTLGPPFGNQNVTVTVVSGYDNQPVTGAPVVFNATGQ